MRALLFLLAGVFLCALQLLAADITADEKRLQTEFSKAYRVNDKDARKTALSMMASTKHPTSWQQVAQIAGSDPDPEVRLEALTIYAKYPAHDGSVSHALANFFSGLKVNDADNRLAYAKAMAPVEFKYEIVATLVDALGKMRFPDIPPLINSSTGNNAQQIEKAKKDRKNFEELLEAFNAIAKSELQNPTKDSPVLIKKWFETNAAALAKADRELADKYKKEDAEAAKAAKAEAEAAAKAAKGEDAKKPK